MIERCRTGDYAFIPGISAYSSGVVAEPGFQVARMTCRTPLPLRIAFECIQDYVQSTGRPSQAVCALEFRIPVPFDLAGFEMFNAAYVDRLRAMGLLVGDANPIARTTVAPAIRPPSEPELYAFAYTVPATDRGRSFVAAGAGELVGASLLAEDVVRLGETSPGAMLDKAEHVVSAIATRLVALGVSWGDVTATDVYTAESMDTVVRDMILSSIGPAAAHGIHWHVSRPPIDHIVFEMDARGVAIEGFLA